MTASPLHATRAGVGGTWCLALGTVGLCAEHPLLLAALLLAEAGVALLCGLRRALAQSVRWGIPFALSVVAINVLVTRDGATVWFRGPRLPVFGQLDFTAEALAYGGVLGLRILAVFGAAVLLSSAVDADELLRGLRRVSLRSGVTAALALRLFGVLRRDAARLADAQRALPGGGASRLQVLHAVTTGALDRATDVAATLEVRGFGTGRRPPRMARPWSRHDVAFALSSVVVVVLAAGAVAGAWGGFDPYPRLELAWDGSTWAAAGALVVVALLPFGDRRGVGARAGA